MIQISLFAALLFVPTSSYAQYEDLLNADTVEKKLHILFSLQEEVSTLLHYSAEYDVDLLALVENQIQIARKLNDDPSSQKLNASRGPLLRISVSASGAQKISYMQTNAGQLSAWGARLVDGLGAERSISKGIEYTLAKMRDWNPDSLIVGLASCLPPERRKDIFQASPEEKISLFKTLLPENLLALDFKRARLTATPSKAQALQVLQERLAAYGDAKERLPRLILARVLSGSDEPEAALTQLRNLSVSDLDRIGQPEDLRRLVEGLGIESAWKIAGSEIRAELRRVSERVEEKTTAVKGTLSLVEKTPLVATVRGCVGHNCSTSYSAGYGLAPMERTFWIEDPNGKNVGMISGVTVDGVNGKSSFYITMLDGPNLTAAQTELALQTLWQSRQSLGVEQILLPEPTKIPDLVNASTPRSILVAHSEGSQAIGIIYRDGPARNIIRNSTRINRYDHPTRNASGRLFQPKVVPSHQTKVEKITPPRLTARTDNFRNRVFEWLVNLAVLAPTKIRKDVLDLIQVDRGTFESIARELSNPGRLDLAEFDKKAGNLLATVGLTENFEALKAGGILMADDNLAPANVPILEDAFLFCVDRDIHRLERQFLLSQKPEVLALPKIKKAVLKAVRDGDPWVRYYLTKFTSAFDYPEFHEVLTRTIATTDYPRAKELAIEMQRALAQFKTAQQQLVARQSRIAAVIADPRRLGDYSDFGQTPEEREALIVLAQSEPEVALKAAVRHRITHPIFEKVARARWDKAAYSYFTTNEPGEVETVVMALQKYRVDLENSLATQLIRKAGNQILEQAIAQLSHKGLPRPPFPDWMWGLTTLRRAEVGDRVFEIVFSNELSVEQLQKWLPRLTPEYRVEGLVRLATDPGCPQTLRISATDELSHSRLSTDQVVRLLGSSVIPEKAIFRPAMFTNAKARMAARVFQAKGGHFNDDVSVLLSIPEPVFEFLDAGINQGATPEDLTNKLQQLKSLPVKVDATYREPWKSLWTDSRAQVREYLLDHTTEAVAELGHTLGQDLLSNPDESLRSLTIRRFENTVPTGEVMDSLIICAARDASHDLRERARKIISRHIPRFGALRQRALAVANGHPGEGFSARDLVSPEKMGSYKVEERKSAMAAFLAIATDDERREALTRLKERFYPDSALMRSWRDAEALAIARPSVSVAALATPPSSPTRSVLDLSIVAIDEDSQAAQAARESLFKTRVPDRQPVLERLVGRVLNPNEKVSEREVQLLGAGLGSEDKRIQRLAVWSLRHARADTILLFEKQLEMLATSSPDPRLRIEALATLDKAQSGRVRRLNGVVAVFVAASGDPGALNLFQVRMNKSCADIIAGRLGGK